jgi:hypothetical protein
MVFSSKRTPIQPVFHLPILHREKGTNKKGRISGLFYINIRIYLCTKAPRLLATPQSLGNDLACAIGHDEII